MKVKAIAKDKVKLPEYATKGAAGADVSIVVPGIGDSLAPGEIKKFRTGLSLTIPEGYYIQLLTRSGCALNGLIVHAGVIDSDYRGEVEVVLQNVGRRTLQLANGDRVAQAILHKLERIEWTDTDVLPATKRGAKGFGSTGK